MTTNNERCGDDPTSWDWVDPQVLKTESTMRRLSNTLTPANLLQPNLDPTTLSFVPCTKFDRVCFPRTQDGKQDFFYVYKVLFTELRLRLPFTDFQVQILNKINAAPTQLHPNGWIFVISFELLCKSLALVPTVRTFFYFFQLVEKGKGWVHIHARQGTRKILELDQRTYNFKNRYFRVEGYEGSVPFFMGENKKPKFPLHWSKSIQSPDSPAFPTLSDCERTLVIKLQQLQKLSSCATLINPNVVFSSDESSASGRRTDTDLNGVDETEEKEAEEVSSADSEQMKTKRKRVFTLGEAEQMIKKKQKLLVENSAPPRSSCRKQNNIADVEMEEQHLRGFEGEGRVASLWDRRFDFDRHVRDHLFFCSDQDRLRRTGQVEVARFVKANALRIAAGAEFLEEQLEVSRKEVSRLNSELAKERSAGVNAAEEKAGREKAERELAMCEAELARARRESEYTEGCLLREWKKSVTESFQNAIDQVRLGFPYLNLDSIALDPFKVVEGELLVEPPSARRW